MLKIILVATACIGLAACNAGGGAPTANLPAMNVAFKWCSSTPEFTIANIPATAKTLNFRMVDQQVPNFNHGGGSIAASGKATQAVPCGALAGGVYSGPTPPPPQVHDYQWTVTAVDAGGQAVAVGRATRKFPE